MQLEYSTLMVCIAKPETELNPERGINVDWMQKWVTIWNRLKVIGYVNKWMKVNEGLRTESQNKYMMEN